MLRKIIFLAALTFCGIATGAIRQSELCADGTYHQTGFCPAELESPSAGNVGETTADGMVTVDRGDGILYGCVTTSNTPLSAAAIIDCSSGTGVSESVAASGTQTLNATGLSAGGTYYWHFVNINPSGWASNVEVSNAFTTDEGIAQTQFYFASNGNDSTGLGTQASPWASIAKANSISLDPGDTLYFRRGDTFTGELVVDDSGASPARITVDSYGSSSGAAPILRRATFSGDWLLVQNIAFDADKGAFRPVTITGDNVTLQDFSIANATRNCLEINGATNFLVDSGEISFCLNGNWNSDPIQDAHGIVVSADQQSVTGTLSNLNIHEVSGDSIQTNPNRPSEQGFTINLTFEDSTCWTQPLAANFNAGWVAGNSPGENCIDTKAASGNGDVINLTVTNVTTYGFTQDANTPPAMTNRAAFNLKESVNAVFNRITCYDSEICFRVRGNEGNGNADLTLMNAVVYDADVGIRAESALNNLEVYNATFGSGITTFLTEVAGGINAGSDLRNNVFLGTVPGDFSDDTNVQASAGDFASEASNDYRPLDTATGIVDQGDTIAAVTDDRNGTARSAPYNIGAYETSVSGGEHAYFEFLASQPEMVLTKSFSSASLYDGGPTQEVADTKIRSQASGFRADRWTYDATEDAVRLLWDAEEGSMSAVHQLRWGDAVSSWVPAKTPPAGFGNLGRGTWFAVWDWKFDSNWEIQNRDMVGPGPDVVDTHKAFQFARSGGNITFEPRFRYSGSASQCGGPSGNQVASFDIRLYNGGGTGPGNSMPGVQNCVFAIGESWFRLIVFMDNSGAQPRASFWVDFSHDEEGPIVIYDEATGPSTSTWETLEEFWFELNSSDVDGNGIYVESYMWGRNWVVLEGLTHAEAEALAQQSSW